MAGTATAQRPPSRWPQIAPGGAQLCAVGWIKRSLCPIGFKIGERDAFLYVDRKVKRKQIGGLLVFIDPNDKKHSRSTDDLYSFTRQRNVQGSSPFATTIPAWVKSESALTGLFAEDLADRRFTGTATRKPVFPLPDFPHRKYASTGGTMTADRERRRSILRPMYMAHAPHVARSCRACLWNSASPSLNQQHYLSSLIGRSLLLPRTGG